MGEVKRKFVFSPFVKQVSDIFRRLLVWLLRFRHRCGYGIHSPFAFSLVTGVVYERGEYYAYAPLRVLRRREGCSLREKDDRLLFRLVNAAEPETVLVCGECSKVTLAYLRAGRERAKMEHLVHPDERSLEKMVARLGEVGFLYIDSEEKAAQIVKCLIPSLAAKAFVVIRGIHTDCSSFAAWRELIADPRIRVSFDLYDFGLLCFETRLNKENHIINYF